MRSLVFGSNRGGASASRTIPSSSGRTSATICAPRSVRTIPRPCGATTGAPSAILSRPSAALMAGWVR